jgi:carboxylesterase 2
MSEDCLTLNVWTPDPSTEAALPVLVWIYGGRFIFGTGADPQYDGSGIAARGTVVVTLNYRSGVFGFLATPELSAESPQQSSGNYGLLDQVHALQWVQRNIAAFGGDPAKVTIAGQSAGAACVMNLVYSPLADGLFRGAIAESGALYPKDPGLAYLAAAYRSKQAAEVEGVTYMREHGVSSIAEMRALSTDALLQGNDADERSHGHPHRPPPLFRPVLDGHVFPRTYMETLTAGLQKDVPVITGTNLDEDGASPIPRTTLDEYITRAAEKYGELAEEFLALYPASTDAEAGVMTNLAAREQSRTSTHLWARLRAAHSTTPAYTYFWTHAAPGHDADTRGAFHGSEIWYFLNSLHSTDRPWGDQDRFIADRMSEYVSNFIATGDPNGDDLPRWDAFERSGGRPMEIGDAWGAREIADPDRFDFQKRYLTSRQRVR